jgi:predicted phage tail protein
MALKRVFLHGPLREKWPEPFECDAKTAAEAINAFCLQTKVLNPVPGQHRPVFQVVGFEDPRLLFTNTTVEDIHLVPAMMGGAKGGFLQIILGVALIAASFIPGLNAVTLPLMGSMSSMLLSMGMKFILGGLMSFLSPAPTLDSSPSDQDPEPSKYLGAPKNTVKIGTRIPILYGEVKIGGHYLSFDIDAKDTSKGEVVSNSGGFGGKGSYYACVNAEVASVASTPDGLTGFTFWTITFILDAPAALPGISYTAEWFSRGEATKTKDVTYTERVDHVAGAYITFRSDITVLNDLPNIGDMVTICSQPEYVAPDGYNPGAGEVSGDPGDGGEGTDGGL